VSHSYRTLHIFTLLCIRQVVLSSFRRSFFLPSFLPFHLSLLSFYIYFQCLSDFNLFNLYQKYYFSVKLLKADYSKDFANIKLQWLTSIPLFSLYSPIVLSIFRFYKLPFLVPSFCIQYNLEFNPHPNQIRTSYVHFLNEKKKVSSRF